MDEVIKIAFEGLIDGIKHIPRWAWLVGWSLWGLNWYLSKKVGDIIAPTSASSMKYRQWFRWLNMWAGNPARARLWSRGLPIEKEEEEIPPKS